MLPDAVSSRLSYESRRRGLSVAAIVREAVERYFSEEPKAKPLSFTAVGEGTRDGSERVGEVVRSRVRKQLTGD